jgi:hypothetical protein
MPQHDLSDEQWCVLDLLMRARKKGIHALNRMEVLNSPQLPDGAKMKLTWAALTMPKALVTWISHHNFTITDEGAQVYNLRFNTPEPTMVADSVIYLPGPTAAIQ